MKSALHRMLKQGSQRAASRRPASDHDRTLPAHRRGLRALACLACVLLILHPAAARPEWLKILDIPFANHANATTGPQPSFARAGGKWIVNGSGGLEEVGNDGVAIDWTNGYPAGLFELGATNIGDNNISSFVGDEGTGCTKSASTITGPHGVVSDVFKLTPTSTNSRLYSLYFGVPVANSYTVSLYLIRESVTNNLFEFYADNALADSAFNTSVKSVWGRYYKSTPYYGGNALQRFFPDITSGAEPIHIYGYNIISTPYLTSYINEGSTRVSDYATTPGNSGFFVDVLDEDYLSEFKLSFKWTPAYGYAQNSTHNASVVALGDAPDIGVWTDGNGNVCFDDGGGEHLCADVDFAANSEYQVNATGYENGTRTLAVSNGTHDWQASDENFTALADSTLALGKDRIEAWWIRDLELYKYAAEEPGQAAQGLIRNLPMRSLDAGPCTPDDLSDTIRTPR